MQVGTFMPDLKISIHNQPTNIKENSLLATFRKSVETPFPYAVMLMLILTLEQCICHK